MSDKKFDVSAAKSGDSPRENTFRSRFGTTSKILSIILGLVLTLSNISFPAYADSPALPQDNLPDSSESLPWFNPDSQDDPEPTAPPVSPGWGGLMPGMPLIPPLQEESSAPPPVSDFDGQMPGMPVIPPAESSAQDEPQTPSFPAADPSAEVTIIDMASFIDYDDWIFADLYTPLEDIPFPMTITATAADGEPDGYHIPVLRWVLRSALFGASGIARPGVPVYDSSEQSVYEFFPVFAENIILAPGARHPVLTVIVTLNIEIARTSVLIDMYMVRTTATGINLIRGLRLTASTKAQILTTREPVPTSPGYIPPPPPDTDYRFEYIPNVDDVKLYYNSDMTNPVTDLTVLKYIRDEATGGEKEVYIYYYGNPTPTGTMYVSVNNLKYYNYSGSLAGANRYGSFGMTRDAAGPVITGAAATRTDTTTVDISFIASDTSMNSDHKILLNDQQIVPWSFEEDFLTKISGELADYSYKYAVTTASSPPAAASPLWSEDITWEKDVTNTISADAPTNSGQNLYIHLKARDKWGNTTTQTLTVTGRYDTYAEAERDLSGEYKGEVRVTQSTVLDSGWDSSVMVYPAKNAANITFSARTADASKWLFHHWITGTSVSSWNTITSSTSALALGYNAGTSNKNLYLKAIFANKLDAATENASAGDSVVFEYYSGTTWASATDNFYISGTQLRAVISGRDLTGVQVGGTEYLTAVQAAGYVTFTMPNAAAVATVTFAPLFSLQEMDGSAAEISSRRIRVNLSGSVASLAGSDPSLTLFSDAELSVTVTSLILSSPTYIDDKTLDFYLSRFPTDTSEVWGQLTVDGLLFDAADPGVSNKVTLLHDVTPPALTVNPSGVLRTAPTLVTAAFTVTDESLSFDFAQNNSAELEKYVYQYYVTSTNLASPPEGVTWLPATPNIFSPLSIVTMTTPFEPGLPLYGFISATDRDLNTAALKFAIPRLFQVYAEAQLSDSAAPKGFVAIDSPSASDGGFATSSSAALSLPDGVSGVRFTASPSDPAEYKFSHWVAGSSSADWSDVTVSSANPFTLSSAVAQNTYLKAIFSAKLTTVVTPSSSASLRTEYKSGAAWLAAPPDMFFISGTEIRVFITGTSPFIVPINVMLGETLLSTDTELRVVTFTMPNNSAKLLFTYAPLPPIGFSAAQSGGTLAQVTSRKLRITLEKPLPAAVSQTQIGILFFSDSTFQTPLSSITAANMLKVSATQYEFPLSGITAETSVYVSLTTADSLIPFTPLAPDSNNALLYHDDTPPLLSPASATRKTTTLSDLFFSAADASLSLDFPDPNYKYVYFVTTSTLSPGADVSWISPPASTLLLGLNTITGAIVPVAVGETVYAYISATDRDGNTTVTQISIAPAYEVYALAEENDSNISKGLVKVANTVFTSTSVQNFPSGTANVVVTAQANTNYKFAYWVTGTDRTSPFGTDILSTSTTYTVTSVTTSTYYKAVYANKLFSPTTPTSGGTVRYEYYSTASGAWISATDLYFVSGTQIKAIISPAAGSYPSEVKFGADILSTVTTVSSVTFVMPNAPSTLTATFKLAAAIRVSSHEDYSKGGFTKSNL